VRTLGTTAFPQQVGRASPPSTRHGRATARQRHRKGVPTAARACIQPPTSRGRCDRSVDAAVRNVRHGLKQIRRGWRVDVRWPVGSDDVPRAPSGRIPRWVLDEHEARSAPPAPRSRRGERGASHKTLTSVSPTPAVGHVVAGRASVDRRPIRRRHRRRRSCHGWHERLARISAQSRRPRPTATLRPRSQPRSRRRWPCDLSKCAEATPPQRALARQWQMPCH